MANSYGNVKQTKSDTNGRLASKHDTTLHWIIDSGATNHMAGDLKKLQDVRDISSSPIGVPDGSQVFATKEGMIRIDEHLTLDNILYASRLTYHLISVSQLYDTSKYNMQFASDVWIVQDRITRMLIGVSKRHDRLYYYHSLPKIKAMKMERITALDLWHKRLEHPSEKVTKLLPNIDFRNCVLDKNCEVCFKSK